MAAMNRRRRSPIKQDLDREKLLPDVPQVDGTFSHNSFRNNAHPKLGLAGFKLLPALLSLALIVAVILGGHYLHKLATGQCDNRVRGFWCHSPTSHLWGQYSPWFSIHETAELRKGELERRLNIEFPYDCSLDVVSILSRHGARGPTATKNERYNDTVQRIKEYFEDGKSPGREPRYEFLNNYKFTFEPDQLNKFGKKQLEQSGRQAFHRYGSIEAFRRPFIRASDQQRVVESAEHWRHGWVEAANSMIPNDLLSAHSDADIVEETIPIVRISECDQRNSTLHHSRCTAHETGSLSRKDEEAQEVFQINFNSLKDQLNREFRSETVPLFNVTDVINLMQLCAFDTLDKKPKLKLSPFCHLFSIENFRDLNYYETLDKYYSFGHGNELGPTQGVGWVNELLARLTDTPVNDSTSTNRTLDSDPNTFPLPRHGTHFFADFSHDNDMVGIVSALGLYKGLDVPTHERRDIIETNGFSSAWVCPFAARVFVEKMTCPSDREGLKRRRRDEQNLLLNNSNDDNGVLHPKREEFVRIIVNDRVMYMPCRSGQYSEFGLCTLKEFLEDQRFAREGGNWSRCFEDTDVTSSFVGYTGVQEPPRAT